MTLDQKKEAFTALGRFLMQFKPEGSVKADNVLYNDLFFDTFEALVHQSQSHNGWFTPEQVFFAVQSWAEALTPDKLNTWVSLYDLDRDEPKTVGLILAGNIPLVGFHDFLSVLISGHRAVVKTSSNDQKLLPFLAKYLIAVEPAFAERIRFEEGKLTKFDAVIATGSNNTSRYFEYYFKDKPSIIRKNRNSVAVLTGRETSEQLFALGEDIFRYFGLGCRNVSKIFVPEGYNFTDFFAAIYPYGEVIHYEKYANNYDYNKAVFLMSNFKLIDNEFLTLKEDTGLASPISSLFYEFYSDLESVQKRLALEQENLQCIVAENVVEGEIAFGTTQKPELWDYADRVDTLRFLSSL
jgi:hypothetical protein